MSRTAPLNVFQKVMRRWDAVHPYNAGQFLLVEGDADLDRWQTAWHRALVSTGLGRLRVDAGRYEFFPTQSPPPLSAPTGPFDSVVTAEINRRFDDPDEPPFRPMLVRRAGSFYLGLMYQHWLADSVAIRMLLREWFFHATDPTAVDTVPLKLPRRGLWNTFGPGRGPADTLGAILDLTRRHGRLRRVQKVGSNHLDEYDTQYVAVDTRPGLIDAVRSAARRAGVKVNDLFLASLALTAAAHVPLQRRTRRTDVAVGSVVDLRPGGFDSLSHTFGLYLGFTNVICGQNDLRSTEAALRAIARQTAHQKRTGVATASLMWMSAALGIGALSKPRELYHFYRKEMPLAGGISNVDLTRDWPATYPMIRQYVRVSPTGPMTPLVFTATTLGSEFNLGMTHRTGLLPVPLATTIAQSFVRTLESFAS